MCRQSDDVDEMDASLQDRVQAVTQVDLRLYHAAQDVFARVVGSLHAPTHQRILRNIRWLNSKVQTTCAHHPFQATCLWMEFDDLSSLTNDHGSVAYVPF